MIASFIISKYFSYIKIDERIKFNSKVNFTFHFGLSFLAYMFFFIGVIFVNEFIIVVSIVILGLTLLKELIITIFKINYYDKKFKKIIKDNLFGEFDKRMIKKNMVKDAIKNDFYLLSSPVLVLEKEIKFLLNCIFK